MKTERIELRVSKKEKDRIQDNAISLGFNHGKSASFSKYLRYVMEYKTDPLDRDFLEEVLDAYKIQIRLSGLLNQTLYHLNRELVIMNDRGVGHKENKLMYDKFLSLEETINDILNEQKTIKELFLGQLEEP